MEMKIEKALSVLNENKIKVIKTPEQIARRRERAKARRAAKKAPALIEKINKMSSRVSDFQSMIDAPWISRALANDDYKSVSEEKDKINKLFKAEVADAFDKIADDVYKAINHDRKSPLFVALSNLCRKIENLQFGHGAFCSEPESMRQINWV